MTFEMILGVYRASDAEATKAMYALLMTFAPRGVVAVNLLRACKASERAKKYRGRGFKAAAYDKKDWSLGELCGELRENPDVIESWGWGLDRKAIGFENVLYVDMPGAGQVSFHSGYRRDGPDYAGRYDGVTGVAARRICRWAEAILNGHEVSIIEGGSSDGVPTGTEGAPTQGVEGGQEGRQETFDL